MINQLTFWAEDLDIEFSTTKTKMMVFTNRHITNIPDMMLKNRTIERVFRQSYLGCLIDQKLTLQPIVEHIKQSCIRRLNIMKILSEKTWGANTVFMLEFYCKYIGAKIDCASLFYNIASESTLNKVEVIQNGALEIAFGARSTTPISFLLIESGIADLQTRREQQMLKYLKKIWLPPSSHPCKL